MAITVFLNQVRAGTVTTDRLITNRPPPNLSVDTGSCIDMIVAVKGHYSQESAGASSKVQFNKFMAHLSFGKSDKVPFPGSESYQGSLESLEIMVEKAKSEGLTGLHTFMLCVDPSAQEEKAGFIFSPTRHRRFVGLLEQWQGMLDRLGGTYEIIETPSWLSKLELWADEEFSTFNGMNTEQDGSDLSFCTYQNPNLIVRFPSIPGARKSRKWWWIRSGTT